MAHVHTHDDHRNTYFLDQLFMIGVCGALAGVTIMLWYSGLLGRILHPKFHVWVIAGGISLLGIVILRAVAVWHAVDAAAHTREPVHEHVHAHEECAHDHEHEHGIQHDHDHDHDHSHGHSHGHAHGHGADHGHTHGWSPWRYVVLMLPVALYFLILSNPAFDQEPVYNPVSAVDKIQNFIGTFRSILWEALPFIVLGALIAGLLEELLPQQVLTRLLPRSRFLAILMGGLLGLLFPMCECGIVPVMRRLLRKGLPLSCCVAYLLAGPIINVVVILSTFAAFSGMENTFEGGKPSYQMGGLWMVGFRVGLGYLVAIVTALIVDRVYQKHGDALLTPLARPSELPIVEEENGQRRSLWERVNNITETALHDFVDITVYLILGALLAATVRMFLTSGDIANLSSQHAVLSILLMMGLAIALCLCSEADAFVAASFVTLRPAAKVAFLVLGPMLDFKLYMMYTRVFRPRLIWTIFTAVVVQVLIYSYITHLVWERYAPQWITPVQSGQAGEHKSALPLSVARTVGVMAYPGAGGPIQAAAALLAENSSDEVTDVNFLQLEMAATTAEQRHFYAGKQVRLVGRFVPIDDRRFTLVRYKINCCTADAIPLKAIVIIDSRSPDKLPVHLLQNKWVFAQGRVQFLQEPGTDVYHTAIILSPTPEKPLSEFVGEAPMEANPYL
jgi:uncharacterized membrane protein YraQ (UPF0718 family)